MSTSDTIAALKANAEALKAPLRARYWELEALRQPHVERLAKLQADRDARVDDLTAREDREICAAIRVEREALDATSIERGQILRALKDDDGKTRLGSA